MHGIPLYKLICDWVIEYEKDFVSRAAKAIEDLESKQRQMELFEMKDIDNSNNIKLKANLRPVIYEEKSGTGKSIDKLEDFELRDWANMY